MKNILAIIAVLGLVSGCHRQEAAPEHESPSEPAKNSVNLDVPTQQRIGLKTETLSTAQLNPETKVYGRVVEPSALVAEAGDVEIARIANETSQAELNRLKTLAAQDNASLRALQAAQVAAARDSAAYGAAQLKVLANWGAAIAERADLSQLVDSIGRFQSALVRLDVPAGEAPEKITGARIVTLEQKSVQAVFAGEIPAVDAQTQNRSFLFLVQSNAAALHPGGAVTGFLQKSGEVLNGTIVPRGAVIRHEGACWVYTVANGTNFSRRMISLELPTDTGWFVTNGVAAGENVVVVGAQTVFSDELSANGFNSGERE